MTGWLFTLPAAGAVGGVMAFMVAWLGGWGILIDAIFAVAVILTIFLLSRRNAVTARENPAYQDEMQALRARLLATNGSVVYFRIEVHPRRHLAQEAEVQEMLGLETVDRTGKGTVYRPVP